MPAPLLFLLILSAVVSCTPSGGGPKASSPEKDASSTNESSPTTDSATPVEDLLAQYAWHLKNTGQKVFSSTAGTSGQDFDIQNVHDSGIKGTGIRIAVSDTGTEVSHPDLSSTQWSGQHRNYSSSVSTDWRNSSPFENGIDAHGTAVAGLIAAAGWNGIGSRGVAPGAKYGAFLYLGDFDDSESSYLAKTLDQMSGSFDIYNYSYGYAGCNFLPAYPSVLTAYKSGVTNLRSGKGAIYVKAAGNEYIGYNSDCDSSDDTYFFGNTNADEEQNHPYVILAAALNAKGERASYSTPGSGIWVSSAGGEFGDDAPAMLTTDLTSCDAGYSESGSSVTGFNKGNTLNPDCNYTSVMNGTSSAAPVLSGIIALMLEANPSLTWRDVKHILATTAEKVKYSTLAISHPAGVNGNLAGHVYDYNYVVNAAGISFSNTYGFGRVNANAAVSAAKTFTSLSDYVESAYFPSGNINTPIPDRSATGATSTIPVTANLILESVQIQVSTDHPYLADLGIELVSPSGTRSKIMLINSNINQAGLTDYTMISNAFYGESSAGTWTIKVVDGALQDTGKLIQWKIKVNGREN